MNEVGQDEVRNEPRRRTWPSLVYLVLVVVAVASALWVRRRWINPPPESNVSASSYQPESATTQRADWDGKVSAARLAKQPLGRVGLKAIRQDPGEFKPPPGARFQTGLQRDLDGYRYQQISYRYLGEMTTAREYYAGSLKARGFKWINPAAPAGRSMVFQSRRVEVRVLIKKRTSPRGDVSIGVTVVRPAG